MMPGMRSLGRVGASPVLEPAAAVRPAWPSSVDLRRQQLQPQQPNPQQQHQQPPQQPQQQQVQQRVPPSASQRREVERSGLRAALGPRDKLAPSAEDPQHTDLPLALERGSVAHSRCSGSSSGSEHEPSSECLAGLVSDFMEVEIHGQSKGTRGTGQRDLGASPGEEEEEFAASILELSNSIQALTASTSPLESQLTSDVLCAVQLVRSAAVLPSQDPDWVNQVNGGSMRRAVMSRLRAIGYNAAICKSRWDHSRGFPGGDYEYIDVVFTADSSLLPRERLIVDVDFRAQFQVARPTPQFEVALLAAPVVFVGRVEKLQQLVEMLSDACRRSLRVQGMHLPPWRKVEYLRAKWLAPYKRTTNALASAPPSVPNTTAVSPDSIPLVSQASAFQPAIPQLSFGRWPEAVHKAPAMLRNCQPVQRHRAAPRGVLGMLLQQDVGKAPPAS